MEVTFLILIFSRKEYQSSSMLQLSRSVGEDQEARELIFQLAESLTPIASNFPQNEQIICYFKHLQQHPTIQPISLQSPNANILLNPQCYHPMQVFCERLSEVLRQAYKQLKMDEILFIRRELSLRSRLQCDLILCDRYPDDCQYPLDYAKMLLYAKKTSEGMILLNKKIHYFENSRQCIRANKLKELRFILFSIYCNPIDPKNLLSADSFGRKEIYIKLVLVYIETLQYKFLPIVSADFARLYPESNDLLALVFISRMVEDTKTISPEQYCQFIQDVTPELHFYNISRLVSHQMVGLFNQAEAYLQKDIKIRRGRDLFARAAFFYFKIGEYQLCLDYTFRLNMYVEMPSNHNLMIALCYLKLNQPNKAIPIIQAAQYSMSDLSSMGLLLSFNLLGQPFKVIDLGQELIYGGVALRNILAIKIKIIILINYQKIKLPIRDFFNTIVEDCCYQRVRFGQLTRQFSIFSFMCQFCYSSQDRQIFKHREFFVGKVWSVIHQTERYSKEGASRMTERFFSKQPVNIQSEFLH